MAVACREATHDLFPQKVNPRVDQPRARPRTLLDKLDYPSLGIDRDASVAADIGNFLQDHNDIRILLPEEIGHRREAPLHVTVAVHDHDGIAQKLSPPI